MQIASTLALLCVLVLAVLKDTQAHRIPNVLMAAGVVGGLLLQALAGGMPAVLTGLAGLTTGVVALLPFYLLRGMGAGDVKLMGTAGTFMGPEATFLAAAVTLVIGALLGLGIVAGRLLSRVGLSLHRAPLPPDTQPRISHSIRKEKFPYAIAIAGGCLTSLNQHGQLRTLADFLFAWSA